MAKDIVNPSANGEPTLDATLDAFFNRGIEPIVQDFAERYIPMAFRPGQPQPSESASFHISPLQLSSDDDEMSAPAPDLSRRGIHIPSRTSSIVPPEVEKRRVTCSSSIATPPDSLEVSSYGESVMSFETSASSVPVGDLPALQTKPIDEAGRLSPLIEDDPGSFDLVVSSDDGCTGFSLEKRSEQLFSKEHLQEIFSDPAWMLRFTSFLSQSRPHAIPLLVYYLDSLKALKAIRYANAIADALEPLDGHDFTQLPAKQTVNSALEEKAEAAFDALVRDELPAWITHVFIQYVSVSIHRRITGTLPLHLRDASEGLAEVFCLTDPSRPDNPIVFASEEFHRTTQYGVNYAIGRNCRFLQGPRTSPHSVGRLRRAINEQREISEVFLNYRRDGSPFMNLLLCAPLFDSRGSLRYFIGAQVDVSGLVKECTDLEALQQMLARHDAIAAGEEVEQKAPKEELQELSEMLNMSELETVWRFGGNMHRERFDEPAAVNVKHPRLLLKEPSPDLDKVAFNVDLKQGGKLEGIYQNYLLVRPYPSLRILFASPALRVPGMLQSPFLSRIGGSSRVRDELTSALAASRGVTAKVRWIAAPRGPRYGTSDGENVSFTSADDGRTRWIHCTPLLGHNGAVGVWMVVIVDDDGAAPRRRLKAAPPVARDLGKAAHAQRSTRPSIGDDSVISAVTNGGRMKGQHATASSKSQFGDGRPSSSGSNSTLRTESRQQATKTGAYAEWERKAAQGTDGDGSMRSFAI